MDTTSKHQSILVEEVVRYLAPTPNGQYLDATFGGGGHSRAILLSTDPTGKVVAVDRDSITEKFATDLKKDYPKRFSFTVLPYSKIGELNETFEGALLDLGLSSDQLEESGRGFSFQKKAEPLDLRFDARSGQTAAQFLSQASLPKIETVFREYAEDRFWRRLSGKIVATRRQRPIRTVEDFVTMVGSEDPKVLAPLFQALRITVNDELYQLELGLKAIDAVLKPGGRLVVISFHSLEDRIVKNFLRDLGYELLAKKPIQPSSEEVSINPRSRSAKLRAGIKR